MRNTYVLTEYEFLKERNKKSEYDIFYMYIKNISTYTFLKWLSTSHQNSEGSSRAVHLDLTYKVHNTKNPEDKNLIRFMSRSDYVRFHCFIISSSSFQYFLQGIMTSESIQLSCVRTKNIWMNQSGLRIKKWPGYNLSYLQGRWSRNMDGETIISLKFSLFAT